MSDTQYAYAVARIRAKELSLFSAQTIEQLLASKSYDECINMLLDKGWGDLTPNPSAEHLLEVERQKAWELVGELVEDQSMFDVFLYANDYHNLKAAIKMVCTDVQDYGLFLGNGTIDHTLILEAVRSRDFYKLPEAMRIPAQEAYTALAQTRDGQLCDIIVDRAALEAIDAAGKASGDALLERYAALTVGVANIKTAVRCNKTGKSLDFIRRALAPCGTLNVTLLSRAASESVDSICDYLAGTDYADAVSALEQSPSAFERWCDNLMINFIRPQQFQVFGIGPLAAYLLGRENEIKTVRMILAGKRSELPESAIRERVRDMYV